MIVMIFLILFLTIAIIGFGYSAYLDLRYTEFPDWLPYLIIIAAIVSRFAYYFSVSGFTMATLYLAAPMLATGAIFLGLGILLYYAGQWGDGDAWLLGGMGFLFPDSAGLFVSTSGIPFPLILILNFFLVSLVYMIIYSIILGLIKKDVNMEFVRILKEKRIKTGVMIVIFFMLSLVLSSFMIFYRGILPSFSMMLFPFFLSAMIIFFHYGKAIENKAFRKHIDVSDLREGDVIMDGKWVGVTQNDIKKIQKKGGKIWIKEGVRFAPVFIITIIITALFGNLMMFFIF